MYTANSSITFKDVLLVSHMKKDLLSVSKLANDFSFNFTFDEHRFVTKDLKTNWVVVKGK